MSQRCFIGDDLQMSYQKMSYRCLVGYVIKDDLFNLQSLKDTLNLSQDIF